MALAKKIIDFLVAHYLALLMAFLLTLLIFLPIVIFPYLAGDSYNRINIPHHHGYDYYYYLSRGEEALAGNDLGNMALREGKEEQDPIFNYSEKILTAPVRLLNLEDQINIVQLYNFYNFFGIFILILLIYFFVIQLSEDKNLALVCALFVVGGYSIIYNKILFYYDFNVYARPIYPYISSLLFFIFLNILFKSLKERNLKYCIVSGCLFGLMFYVYFYAWSFTLALLGVLSLFFFLKKDYQKLKLVVLSTGIGMLIGGYNLIKLLLYINSEEGRQVSYFFSSVHNRIPIFSKIGVVALILIAFLFYGRKHRQNILFLLALVLAGWVSLNQQIITNTVLQEGHYYWFFIVPLSIIVSFYAIWFLLEKKWMQNTFFLFFIFITFLNTAVGQYRSVYTVLDIRMDEQRYKPVLDFFNKELSPEVILTTNNNIASLYLIYTKHDLFWLDVAALYGASLERMEESLCVHLYLNHYSRNKVQDYLTVIMKNKNNDSFYKSLYVKIEGFTSGLSYYDYVGKSAVDESNLLLHRSQTISELDKKCAILLHEDGNGLESLFKKYGVSYIAWDHMNNPEWDLRFLTPKLKMIDAFNEIDIYKYENTTSTTKLR